MKRAQKPGGFPYPQMTTVTSTAVIGAMVKPVVRPLFCTANPMVGKTVVLLTGPPLSVNPGFATLPRSSTVPVLSTQGTGGVPQFCTAAIAASTMLFAGKGRMVTKLESLATVSWVGGGGPTQFDGTASNGAK